MEEVKDCPTEQVASIRCSSSCKDLTLLDSKGWCLSKTLGVQYLSTLPSECSPVERAQRRAPEAGQPQGWMDIKFWTPLGAEPRSCLTTPHHVALWGNGLVMNRKVMAWCLPQYLRPALSKLNPLRFKTCGLLHSFLCNVFGHLPGHVSHSAARTPHPVLNA